MNLGAGAPKWAKELGGTWQEVAEASHKQYLDAIKASAYLVAAIENMHEMDKAVARYADKIAEQVTQTDAHLDFLRKEYVRNFLNKY